MATDHCTTNVALSSCCLIIISLHKFAKSNFCIALWKTILSLLLFGMLLAKYNLHHNQVKFENQLNGPKQIFGLLEFANIFVGSVRSDSKDTGF